MAPIGTKIICKSFCINGTKCKKYTRNENKLCYVHNNAQNIQYECIICYKNIPVTQMVESKCCKSVYCTSCINRWTTKCPTCPYCRKNMCTSQESLLVFLKKNMDKCETSQDRLDILVDIYEMLSTDIGITFMNNNQAFRQAAFFKLHFIEKEYIEKNIEFHQVFKHFKNIWEYSIKKFEKDFLIS